MLPEEKGRLPRTGVGGRKAKGVGLLVAIGVLVELGDPGRFRNRGQAGSFTGLTPSSHESGEAQRSHPPSPLRHAKCGARTARACIASSLV